MPTNDFLPFAAAGGANVLSQAAYAALTTLVANGFTAGEADSAQLNKVWRQATIMAAVMGAFIADFSGQNAVDDGTTLTLELNLFAAIRSISKQGIVLTDTGAANAYTATNVPPFGSLVSGVLQTVLIAHNNTAASTYAPDGLTAKPIFGLSGAALQGGELIANQLASLMYSSTANGGTGAWILLSCSGGALPCAPGTKNNQAVNLGQFSTALFATSAGYQKFPFGLIVQWGQAQTSVAGSVNITYPMTFPGAVAALTVTERAAAVWSNTNSGYYGAVDLISNSGATIKSAIWNGTAVTIAGSGVFSWIAIGY